MKRLEALAIAICKENEALDPNSEAFRLLNPGLLKSHSLDRLDIVTEDGYRVFTSFQGGYRALMSNLIAKCEGHTRANGDKGRLSPDSSIAELCKTFRGVNPRNVVEFLQDALDDKAITERTPLKFFEEA
jgi:hypothetical protein